MQHRDETRATVLLLVCFSSYSLCLYGSSAVRRILPTATIILSARNHSKHWRNSIVVCVRLRVCVELWTHLHRCGICSRWCFGYRCRSQIGLSGSRSRDKCIHPSHLSSYMLHPLTQCTDHRCSRGSTCTGLRSSLFGGCTLRSRRCGCTTR